MKQPEVILVWKVVENAPPDIILLDLELPDGDGIKVCQELRSLPRFAQTPILVITGHDDHDSIMEALTSGATDFMSKPLNWHLLVQRVRYMWKSHLVLLNAQENQRLLARAQSIAKTGNWEKDLASGVVTASEQFVRMVQHGESESGEFFDLFFNAIVDEDQELLSKKMEEVLQSKKKQTFELRMITDVGFIFCRHFLELRLDSVTGIPLALCGTLQDITEEKRRELLVIDRNRLLELGIKKVDNQKIYQAFCTLIEHQIPDSSGFYFHKQDNHWEIRYVSDNASVEVGEKIREQLQVESVVQTLQEKTDTFFSVSMSSFLDVKAKDDALFLMVPVVAEDTQELNRLLVIVVKKNHSILANQENLKGLFKNILGIIRILVNNSHLFDKLQYQAYYDALTGLPNREFLFETIHQAIAKKDGQWALILIDIDRFKNINDSLGHNVGDRILCELTSRLKQILFPGDVLARLSGDEFVWLTDITSLEGIQNRMQRILMRVNQPFKEKNYLVNLSVSCGIAIFPDHGKDSLQLQKNADIAMLHAKKGGGGCCVYYDPDTMESFTQKLVMENEMKQGLERGEFHLLFQPQVKSSNREIVAYEALLRWNRPDGAFVSPDVFIGVAEETGFIVPLGTWVLEQACRNVLESHKRGYSHIRISVNVSTVQFVQDNFVDIVKDILEKTGFPPDRLELEVTESAVMQDIEIVAARLAELRELGLTIAVDDFGTGYSSMLYLKTLPIDCLKIDRSFIMELGSEAEKKSEALVETMITLAENLKLEVVAEGVETEEQLEFLRQRSCSYIQGYLTGKPGPLPA